MCTLLRTVHRLINGRKQFASWYGIGCHSADYSSSSSLRPRPRCLATMCHSRHGLV